jgi:diaminopimelate decarboxylase
VAKIYVTGMHSGPNPSPGLGVCRSLAESGRHRTVAVDYSALSSGIHSSVPDEFALFPSWGEMDQQVWAEQIQSMLLETESFLISCLDLELRLLAGVGLTQLSGVLSPDKAALSLVIKPPVAIATDLGFKLARSESTSDVEAVARFLRESESGVWVKGQHYEAFRANTVQEIFYLAEHIEATWGTEAHVEAHVPGQESGIAFVAREGSLLGAVSMKKRQLTSEGKTWAGDVGSVSGDFLERLSAWCVKTKWNGAGELELVEKWDGTVYLMELNPRFPAWIHGATVCGWNLPLALVDGAKVLGNAGRKCFTRTVEEIPCRAGVGIPAYRWDHGGGRAIGSKHPSGMPALGNLSRPERKPRQLNRIKAKWVGPELEATLAARIESAQTPQYVCEPSAFEKRLDEIIDRLGNFDWLKIAYSIKTSPLREIMAIANARGLIAEAISQDEVTSAVSVGFKRDQMILNGPAKWWPSPESVNIGGFFADSVEEFDAVAAMHTSGMEFQTKQVGIRIAPLNFASRFGVRLDTVEEIQAISKHLSKLRSDLHAEWGFSFHFAESNIGAPQWRNEVVAMLGRVEVLARHLGAPKVANFGGGWHFDDLDLLPQHLRFLFDLKHPAFKDVDEWILEPGKLLVENSGHILMTVLGERKEGSVRNLLVDGSVAEAPEARFWRHPVATLQSGDWISVGPGSDSILGRSCMEHDILAVGLSLSEVQVGDKVLLSRCGAYDTSMAYQFGRGISQHG